MRKWKVLALLLLPVLVVGGCNLFEWTHPKGANDDFRVLLADGDAAMQAGNYGEAAGYYRRAMSLDTRSSEARKGHAICFARAKGFSMVNFVSYWLGASGKGLSSGSGLCSPVAPQGGGKYKDDNFDIGKYDNFAVGSTNDLEDVINGLIGDLDPIAWDFCDGVIPKNDVSVNAILGLAKIIRAAIDANVLSDKGIGGLVVRETTKEFDVLCVNETNRAKIQVLFEEALLHFDIVAAELDAVEEWEEARLQIQVFMGDAHPELCNGLIENVCELRETEMGCTSGFSAAAGCDKCVD